MQRRSATSDHVVEETRKEHHDITHAHSPTRSQHDHQEKHQEHAAHDHTMEEDHIHHHEHGGHSEKKVNLQAAVFPWLNKDVCPNGKLPRTITAEDLVVKHGVPRKIFKDHIQSEIDEADACMGLPFTLLMVASFAFMAIAHDNAPAINAVEDSITFDITENANFAFSGHMGHKNIDDVNSNADFWSWVSKGFVALIFQQSRSFHEDHDPTDQRFINASKYFPPSERGFLLSYNRIVGAVRFSQERSGEDEEKEPCGSDATLLNFFDEQCVHGHGYELDPEMLIARLTTNRKRVRFLYTFEDYDDLQHKVMKMESEHWLDRHTRKIEIAMPVYNAEFGLHTLVTVNFFFSRGGHIWKKIICLSNYADWHDTWYYGLYDGIWIACLIYIAVVEVFEIRRILRYSGIAGLVTEYIGFWNMIDWGSVWAGLTIISMFSASIQMTMGLNEQMIEIGNLDVMKQAQQYKSGCHKHIDLLYDTVQYIHKLKLALALYPLVIVFRLFKGFAAQPRLAIVTRTLKSSVGDLLHFLFVFCSVFFAFVISGVILFGRDYYGFVSFPRAMNTCFRLLMGEIDFDGMRTIGRVEAGFWLWCFLIIIVLLMMNMLLAIIMDHYGEVKNQAGNAETLWEETKETYSRWRGVRRGELVSLDSIMKGIVAAENEGNKKKKEPEGKLARMLSNIGTPKVRVNPRIAKKQEEEAKARGEGIFHGEGIDGEEEQEEADDENTPLFPDELIRLVSVEAKRPMSWDQALKAMTRAVSDFHEENKSNATLDEILMLTRKVHSRLKSMRKLTNAIEQAKPRTTELHNLASFQLQVSEFVKAMIKDDEQDRQELETLLALKQDLLAQLQELLPGESLRNMLETAIPASTPASSKGNLSRGSSFASGSSLLSRNKEKYALDLDEDIDEAGMDIEGLDWQEAGGFADLGNPITLSTLQEEAPSWLDDSGCSDHTSNTGALPPGAAGQKKYESLLQRTNGSLKK